MNKLNTFIESLGLVDTDGLKANEYTDDDLNDGYHLLASVRSTKTKNFIDCSLDISPHLAAKMIKKHTGIDFKYFTEGSSKYWEFNIRGKGTVTIENYKGRSNYMTICGK